MKKKAMIIAPLCALSLSMTIALPVIHAENATKNTPSSTISITKEELISPTVLKRDFEILYRGLNSIPTTASSYTGGVSAIGKSSFPVAVNPESTPFMAGSRYGKGRVLAVGDEVNLFNLSLNSGDDKSKVARNILIWLTQDVHKKATSYEEALKGKGKLEMITTADDNEFKVNPDLPIALERIENWSDVQLNPSKYPVAFVYNDLKDEDVKNLSDYIRKGGNVVVAQKGWVLEGYPTEDMKEKVGGRAVKISDYPLQQLLNKVGISLMNNIAADKDGGVPKLSFDKAMNYHILRLVDQAKAYEKGSLSPNDIHLGPPDATDVQKLSILGTIVSCTVDALTSESPLLEMVREDSKNLGQVSFPVEKGKLPYTSALLAYTSNQASLSPDGTKSPFADDFPGKVGDNAPVVEDKSIEVDFDYNDFSYLRTLVPPGNWISTGLYVPPGQTITINVPEGAEHLDVQVGAHTDNLTSLSTWQRVPSITLRQTLKPGKNEVKSPYGGLVYLIPTEAKENSKANVSISGAVGAPQFVLGKTSIQDWKDTIRNYESPWAELQSDRIILTVPSDVIRQLDNPEELLKKWDDMLAKYDELIGVGPDNALPHRSADRPHRIVADRQISAGYMHAGYPIMIPIDPEAKNAVDFSKIQTGWGFWHEMGHEYQQTPWFWGDITEVTVNIHSLNMQDYFGAPNRLVVEKDKQGKSYYDKAFEFLNSNDPNKNYNQIGVFERLVMFRQLQLAFGWDFYTQLHIAYRELPENQLPSDDDQEKIDMYVVMSSKTSGKNLLNFYDKWGLKFTDDARKKVEAMKLPQPESPIWMIREDQ
ncbi:M60 family metallopeptidase [Cytobacillus citreus]|nr:M60 family metallopeptidase [Cytobacillus citreus]